MAINKLIIHNNKQCQLITDDTQLFNSIKSFLSFKVAGSEYIPSVRNGYWNGITFLMNKKGYFNSGLINKVLEFLKDKNIECQVEDNRQILIKNKSIDLSASLKKMGLIPRDYQNKIIDIALKNRKGIIRACTGSGKTLCTAIITAELNKPTIIYVIGLDLLKQFHDLFTSLFDEPIGYIGDGTCDIKRINIASIWTIGRALSVDKKDLISDEDVSDEKEPNEHQSIKIRRMLNDTNVHIFDESHVIATNTISEIFKCINPEYIFGFSGTPFRDDNTDLLIYGILGEQIINVSASELIKKGFLAQPIIKFTAIPLMKVTDPTYPSVYKNYVVENTIRNSIIIKETITLLEKKYTPLILFKQIRHGQILFDMMKDQEIKCEMLYGNDSLDRRTEVKELLINKKIDVILASTIFDLGIDLPILNALVLCGGGKSSIRSLQRVGRVIRMAPGKKYACIVDFFDQVKFLKKHSMIRHDTYSSEYGFKVIKCRQMK